MPHHCRGVGKDRLAEILLQCLQYCHRRHSGATEKHRLGILRINRARQSLGMLGSGIVDVLEASQMVELHDLEPMRLEMSFALQCDLCRIRRAERQLADIEPLQCLHHRPEGGDDAPARRSFEPSEQIRFAAAAQVIARRRMRDDDNSGLTIASSSIPLSIFSTIERLRSLCPSSEPGVPCATIRWKCSETPSGAIAIISASTVGFPGGTKKPNLARQPIIAMRSCPVSRTGMLPARPKAMPRRAVEAGAALCEPMRSGHERCRHARG